MVVRGTGRGGLPSASPPPPPGQAEGGTYPPLPAAHTFTSCVLRAWVVAFKRPSTACVPQVLWSSRHIRAAPLPPPCPARQGPPGPSAPPTPPKWGGHTATWAPPPSYPLRPRPTPPHPTPSPSPRPSTVASTLSPHPGGYRSRHEALNPKPQTTQAWPHHHHRHHLRLPPPRPSPQH